MKKPRNRYEVMLPYHQYLHILVEAESPAQALALAERLEDLDGMRLSEHCSTGCGSGAKPKVRLIAKAEGKS